MSSVDSLDLADRMVLASDLVPRAVCWLWPLRLAEGKLAILDGDPEQGKSLLALDLCARLSRGQPWPDGAVSSSGPAPSLVLNGEDTADDTIRPRLEALGADLTRVAVLRAVDALGVPVSLPGDIELLEAAIARSGARLVVIDPVVVFLGQNVSTANDQSVRRALLPLALLGERYRCVILLVRHLNKSGGGRSLYRGGGSIGIVGACRSAWLVARDPKEPQRRRAMAQIKNNLAPPQPTLTFEVVTHEGGGAPATLSWLGTSPLSADELLARQPAPGNKPPSVRERTREFLSNFLEKGPRKVREIWEAAQKEGLSEPTLRRARDELGARSECVFEKGGPKINYWLLRHHTLPKKTEPEDSAWSRGWHRCASGIRRGLRWMMSNLSPPLAGQLLRHYNLPIRGLWAPLPF
jgi:hypothetical protein